MAAHATVHIPVRIGTNLALMHGLVREVIQRGWVDDEFVDRHTTGFDALDEATLPYTPGRVAEICRIRPADVEAAAEVFGTSERVLATVLQGFYQSHQATAASCQVNNLHLLRGMIGRPGCGVLQMNGQPTAQNNRECGANGDLPGFRNWENKAHIDELARLWNVDPMVIPDWAPPTHAMQIFRYVEQGSVGFLWIAGTNPAVSMPDLGRIRAALRNEDCFVVVADGYRTETTEYADVVLPAALWGEKTGTYTNADRTVHLSDQAVAPPGEARSDLDIFLDYARRMDFTDRDGRRLPPWTTPEEVFEAWKDCSNGRPCDYTGLTYQKLRADGGIQWPCNESAPDGTERLYADGRFNTETSYCEACGHHLATGATVTETEHRAMRPDGRAVLKTVPFSEPKETPGEEYPLELTTGRTVYHFHTRTKTGRAEPLQKAAPEVWVEMAASDVSELGLHDGERVRIVSPRGSIEAPVRVTETRAGQVFVPFHYAEQAANELTMTVWDPVSKQPAFKMAAVRVETINHGQ